MGVWLAVGAGVGAAHNMAVCLRWVSRWAQSSTS